MPLTSDKEFWETTDQAVNPMDVSMSVAAPEFDGNLIIVPASVKEDLGQDPPHRGQAGPERTPARADRQGRDPGRQLVPA